MFLRLFTLSVLFQVAFPYLSTAQYIERVSFDKRDSATGHYLAVTPQSKQIKGVVVLLTSFLPPDDLLTETKLHGVAYTNDLLLVVAPMAQKLYADTAAINRINAVLNDIQLRYAADTSKFAIAGYDEAGGIALRYTELAYQHPATYPIAPKAVFTVDSPVDLFGLWHWSEQQIKKNYWPGAVGDAKFYLETMTRENGTIYNNGDQYKKLTPFYKDADSIGNEQYLKDVAVRLYYDADVEWQLANRRNSLYDTKMPDGSELVKRLLLAGNNKAELIASRKQGVRNNGLRHPSTIAIVDEVDCIQWIKTSLNIFDLNTWVPPYTLDVPKGWDVELFSLPADFAAAMTYKGIEDIRFAPGWGDSTKADYWSYAYLWWLDGKVTIDASSLQENLQLYYSGLVNRNIIGRKIPGDKVVPTLSAVKKIKTATGDWQTFSGSVRMLDYMRQRPITLNTTIHLKDCADHKHMAAFVEMSPKPYTAPIWKQMEKLQTGFSCSR